MTNNARNVFLTTSISVSLAVMQMARHRPDAVRRSAALRGRGSLNAEGTAALALAPFNSPMHREAWEGRAVYRRPSQLAPAQTEPAGSERLDAGPALANNGRQRFYRILRLSHDGEALLEV